MKGILKRFLRSFKKKEDIRDKSGIYFDTFLFSEEEKDKLLEDMILDAHKILHSVSDKYGLQEILTDGINNERVLLFFNEDKRFVRFLAEVFKADSDISVVKVQALHTSRYVSESLVLGVKFVKNGHKDFQNVVVASIIRKALDVSEWNYKEVFNEWFYVIYKCVDFLEILHRSREMQKGWLLTELRKNYPEFIKDLLVDVKMERDDDI